MLEEPDATKRWVGVGVSEYISAAGWLEARVWVWRYCLDCVCTLVEIHSAVEYRQAVVPFRRSVTAVAPLTNVLRSAEVGNSRTDG